MKALGKFSTLLALGLLSILLNACGSGFESSNAGSFILQSESEFGKIEFQGLPNNNQIVINQAGQATVIVIVTSSYGIESYFWQRLNSQSGKYELTPNSNGNRLNITNASSSDAGTYHVCANTYNRTHTRTSEFCSEDINIVVNASSVTPTPKPATLALVQALPSVVNYTVGGSQTALVVQVSGGVSPYSYAWEKAAAGLSTYVDPCGNYCTYTNSFQVASTQYGPTNTYNLFFSDTSSSGSLLRVRVTDFAGSILYSNAVKVNVSANSVSPTPTVTPKPTATPTPKPTATPTPKPSATPTPVPSASPTPKPTSTPVPSATPTPKPVATVTPPPITPGAMQIQQVAGSMTNKSSITISGSGFGTKTTAAPVLWDDASSGSVSANWDLAVPSSAANANYNTQYRSTGYRGVAGPHTNATNYIVGGHTNTWAPFSGGNVMINKIMPKYSNGDIVYMRMYYRLDPSWQFGSVEADNNHKWWVVNFGGAGPYQSVYNYIDYNQGAFNNKSSAVGHKYSPDGPEHALVRPDNNGHSNWWDSSANPVSQWTQYEVEYKLATGNDGYLKVWADGKLVMNYAGRTDFGTYSTMALGFGGYSSTYVISPVNNFRYFSDVYIDSTAARVVLANNSNLNNATVIEPQIPIRWSATSIDLKVNLGKFKAGDTAYMFVVDKSGKRSATGFPVVIGQ